MKEEYVVLLNAFLHLFLFLWCLRKYSIQNVSTVISVFFVLSSAASLGLFYSPLYNATFTANGTATLPAVFLQFIITCFWILAFTNCDFSKIKRVSFYNSQVVGSIEKFLTIAFLISVVISLPKTAEMFFSGHDLGEMREDSYGSNLVSFTGMSAILYYNITDYLGGAVVLLLCIPTIKFFLFQENDKWDKLALLVYCLSKLNIMFSVISRAAMVFSLIEVIFCCLLFFRFIPLKTKKKLILLSCVVLPLFVITMSAISSARFSDGDKMRENFNTFRYVGESQLNFMTLLYPDLKEPFWGYTAFPLYRKMLFLDYETGENREGSGVFNTAVQKKFHYNNPTYIFHGFPGTLVFNFGRFGGLLAAFVIFLLIRKANRNKYQKSFMSIVCTIYFSSQAAKSIFFTDMFGISGNWFFIILLFIYIILNFKGYTKKVNRYEK